MTCFSLSAASLSESAIAVTTPAGSGRAAVIAAETCVPVAAWRGPMTESLQGPAIPAIAARLPKFGSDAATNEADGMPGFTVRMPAACPFNTCLRTAAPASSGYASTRSFVPVWTVENPDRCRSQEATLRSGRTFSSFATLASAYT